jgi:hypothetical protein
MVPLCFNVFIEAEAQVAEVKKFIVFQVGV